MLLTASVTDTLQQVLIDAPLWVTFVAPGVLSAIALCIVYALFDGANENRSYKAVLTHSLVSTCIIVAFVFALFYIPAVIQVKGFGVTTALLAIATNLASLSFAIGVVFAICACVSKVLHRVATGTYNQEQGKCEA